MGLENIGVITNLRNKIKSDISKYILIPALSIPLYFGIGCGGDKNDIVRHDTSIVDELPKDHYEVSDKNKPVITEIILTESDNQQKLGLRYNGQEKTSTYKPLSIPTSPIAEHPLKYDLTGGNNLPDGAVNKSDWNKFRERLSKRNASLEDVLAFIDEFGKQTAVLDGSKLYSLIDNKGSVGYENNTGFNLEGITEISLNVNGSKEYKTTMDDVIKNHDEKRQVNFQDDSYNGQQVRVLGSITGNNGNNYVVRLEPVVDRVAMQYVNYDLTKMTKTSGGTFFLPPLVIPVMPEHLYVYMAMEDRGKNTQFGLGVGRTPMTLGGGDPDSLVFTDGKIKVFREEITEWTKQGEQFFAAGEKIGELHRLVVTDSPNLQVHLSI